jgi:hypothetical protein
MSEDRGQRTEDREQKSEDREFALLCATCPISAKLFFVEKAKK